MSCTRRRSGLTALLLATAAFLDVAAAAPAAPTRAIHAPPAPELPVTAWRVFGPGKPDATAQAINPPDGVAFTADGLLLVTDAENHRVQVFNPVSGEHLGSFGDSGTLPGEIVAVAVAPDASVAVSDAMANLVRIFTREDRVRPPFALAALSPLRDARFQKLAAVGYDQSGRLYVIDDSAGVVYRYLPGLVPDPAWRFQPQRPDGGLMLRHVDGMAIHGPSGTLFLSSEWDGLVRACDAETGRWLGKSIGRRTDPASGKPIGESVFSRSVEGLAVFGDYLLAVDEGFSDEGTDRPGHLLVFDLRDPAVYETDAESCRARMAAGKPAGLLGWFGDLLSPDGVAVFTGSPARPDPLVAVADQGHYRVVVYRGAELIRAIHAASAEEGR